MELVIIGRVILGVLLLGMTGLMIELVLLGHYEDFAQWIPLGVTAAGLLMIVLHLAHPRWWTLSLVQVVMALFIASGVLGMYFHYSGSREFQLEMDPALSGTNLIWEVLHAKSPPTLSPGTMIHMGILGLGYTYLKNRQAASGQR